MNSTQAFAYPEESQVVQAEKPWVEELTPSAHAEWDAYVNRQPGATCYHLAAWQTVAERAYRIPSPFLIARERKNGPICGVLPLFAVRAILASRLTNGLFGAYGPILVDHAGVRDSLVDEALRIFREADLNYVLFKCLDNEEDLDPLPGFTRMGNWVIATMPLERDPERLWRGFRDKIRNSVRKAERHGLEFRTGNANLEAFYDVLAENMHRKGSPIYGIEFMREVVRTMGDKAEIHTLWHEGKVVSGALTIHYKKTAYVPFASSRPSAFHMCPNNLLYWELIKRACLQGMETFDFGRSVGDTSPLRFKISWGARVVPQPCYIRTASGMAPKLDPKDPLVDWFVRRWQSLPRPVADTLGPAVCRRWLA